jgi:hypothetical protein
MGAEKKLKKIQWGSLGGRLLEQYNIQPLLKLIGLSL